MPDLHQLTAKSAISEQIYRYCRGIDRMDLECALSVWHADGVVDFADGVALDHYPPGPRPVPVRRHFDWACPFRESFLAHSHQATNILINVNGDLAGSETYNIAVLQKRAADGWIEQDVFWGRWLDRWSCRDGIWAIDYRRAITDCRFTARFEASAQHDPCSRASRRDHDDPSYAFLNYYRRAD